MKRKLLLFTLLLAALPLRSLAYNFSAVAPTGQTLYYSIVSGKAQVTYPGSSAYPPWPSSYTKPTGALTIPDSVVRSSTGVKYAVTSIGDDAFYGCSGLTSVTIPNSVTAIGASAFCFCSGLTSVTIPNSVTSIGKSAFYDVRHIEYYGNATGSPWGAISMNGITEGDFVFSDTTKHYLVAYSGMGGSVNVPTTVYTIGFKAFIGCRGLTSVTIPNSVTSIGNSAFSDCSGLTSVTIPNSVTSIGESAFYYCRGLTSVTIPNSVTSIGKSAFSGCSGLTSVTIPNSVTSIWNHAFYNVRHIEYYGNATGSPWGAISMNGITEGGFVFKDTTKHYLVAYSGMGGSVNVPTTVDTIGPKAFYGCSGLTSVTIPNSVDSIMDSTFIGCSGMTSVTIPNSVTSIGEYAFYGCSALTSVTIPNSVTSIEDYAFLGCSGLTTVNFNADSCWRGIGSFPINISTFTFGNNVKIIPPRLCKGMSGLNSITIPNTVTTIGYNAFEDCSGLTSVTIPNSVTSIGSEAFSNCSGLTSLNIGDSVISIGNGCFFNCSNITTLNYNCPADVPRYIPKTSLQTVIIGDSVQSIAANAFQNGTTLVSVHLGKSIRSIGSGAFSGCDGLDTVNYAGTISQWCNIDFGGYYSNPSGYAHLLIIGGTPVTNLVIPNDVSTVKQYAFRGYSGLMSVTIPNSVTSIGSYAFSGCSGLTSITIPESVTSIGRGAFANCSSLTTMNFNATNCTTMHSYYYYVPPYYFTEESYITTLNIGNDVTNIPSYAFYGCSGLTSVTIPNSVTSIGEKAFYDCSSMSSIYMLSSIAPQVGTSAFSEISNSAIFYVPCHSESSYSIYGTWGTVKDPFHDLSLTVRASDSYLGTASVVEQDGYRIACDSTAIIKAEGKTVSGVQATQFVRWSDGNTDNPRTVHLSGDSTFTAEFIAQLPCTITVGVFGMGSVTGGGTYNYGDTVTLTATPATHYHLVGWWGYYNQVGFNTTYRFRAHGDDTITAYFEEDPQYRISVYSDDEEMGTVEGGGVYYYDEDVTITATPAAHHHFVRWSDGSMSNPRTLRLSGNKTVTAYFEVNQYTVTVTSSDILRGSVEGGGTFTYPEATTVSATAYSGYQFVRWSNGVGHNPYTFAVTADMDLVAIFIPEGSIYNITATSENPSMGTVTGGGPYGVGERAELTAIPEPGYRFDRWSDGSRQNPRTVVVSADATYVAYFVQTVGIEEMEEQASLRVWAAEGRIIVEGAEGEEVRVYDMAGRQVGCSGLRRGVYLVKVGAAAARRVVVAR